MYLQALERAIQLYEGTFDMGIVYRGVRGPNANVVTVCQGSSKPVPLPYAGPFEWGPEGYAGADTLARCILFHHLRGIEDGDNLAVAFSDDFRDTLIAQLPRDHWELSDARINEALIRIGGLAASVASAVEDLNRRELDHA